MIREDEEAVEYGVSVGYADGNGDGDVVEGVV